MCRVFIREQHRLGELLLLLLVAADPSATEGHFFLYLTTYIICLNIENSFPGLLLLLQKEEKLRRFRGSATGAPLPATAAAAAADAAAAAAAAVPAAGDAV